MAQQYKRSESCRSLLGLNLPVSSTIAAWLLWALVGLVLAEAASVSVSAVEVSNRQPELDDIGYLPREGSIERTNPPPLAWLAEEGAAGYTLQLARDADFSQGRLEIPRVPHLLYTHTEPLPAGEWWWRYACLDADGTRSGWSQVRRFTLAADAERFPRPSEEFVRRRMPTSHPRLMLRSEEVSQLRRARRSAAAERWAALVEEANQYLGAALIPEPPPWTGGLWNAEEWRQNYQQATRAAAAAETLAFCYLLSGESRYGEAARRWLLHLASWDPRGTTSIQVNNEAAYPILYLSSRAYDWIYDYLSEQDRATLREMVRTRGKQMYDRLLDLPHEQKAYHSHAGRIWHFLGEAAIAYYGEIPEAEEWLDYALTIFWGWYPAYGDQDGGWAQGYSYWSSYVNRSTWWLDALQAALQIDGTEKPFYRNVGSFPVYVAPPGGALTGFGDFAERRPGPAAAAVVGYFARMRQESEWQWYAESWGQGEPAGGPLGFLRAARSTPPVPRSRPPRDWPTAKLFRGAGWACFHSNLLDAGDSVQVMLRAAPLGNVSHSHSDQNAIVVGAYGSPLLVNTGTRPWYGSPFCREWYWTTKAHNALEIGGEGQPKTGEATAEFVVFQPGEQFDYAVGDATPAYRGRVERYRRHLLFLRPELLVVLDEVKASRPVSLKWWLHGRAPFSIQEGEKRIELEFEKAAMQGLLQAPGGLSIGQSDKYPIPPEGGHTEPEWHLWAETEQELADHRFVAVLGISRAGQKVQISDLSERASAETVTVEFQYAGRAVTISFDTSQPAVVVRP